MLYAKEVIGNKLYKFDTGFFSSGKAAGSVDTGGINGFWQRGMMEKRQAKCKGYFQALTNYSKWRCGQGTLRNLAMVHRQKMRRWPNTGGEHRCEYR
jgi:hypothetical protein